MAGELIILTPLYTLNAKHARDTNLSINTIYLSYWVLSIRLYTLFTRVSENRLASHTI